MVTENDSIKERIATDGKGQVNNEGVPSDGFVDPDGKYPKDEYVGEPSVNKGARGTKVHNLKIKNGSIGCETTIAKQPKAIYPLNQVNESTSGHIIEINDTPGGERILIKHKDGAGVEIKPDGTIIVNSLGNRVDLVSKNHVMAVEGNGCITYYGNLNLTVQGDYNLDVKGDYNVKVGGNNILNVIGNYRKNIVGLFNEVIQKTKTSTVLQKDANTYLSGFGTYTKGKFNNEVDGTAEYSHSGNTYITSESEISMSSPNVNIAASDISVFGDDGTIGGDNVTMFSQNSYVDRTLHASEVEAKKTMKAKVFHGSLNGTAKGAMKAGTAALGASHGGSVDTTSHSKEDPVAQGNKFKPTSTIVNAFLFNEDRGVREVRIDRDDGILHGINQIKNSGGVTDKKLNTSEVRSKLKEQTNLNNNKFLQSQVDNNNLNSGFASVAPEKIGRIKGEAQTARTGYTPIGSRREEALSKKYTLRESSSRGVERTITVDPQYDPNKQSDITMGTNLGNGVPISKFIASAKDPVNLDHTTSAEQRKDIARNLYPHSEIINIFYQLDQFQGYNLVVAEGLYKPGPEETLTPGGVKEAAKDGKFVVYEVYDSFTGQISNNKSFDFAVYLKDNVNYENLIMYYDNYNTDGSLHSQVGVGMPTIPENYTAFFNKKIETVYNGTSQTTSDLIEVLP